jgi:hypothetical protein
MKKLVSVSGLFILWHRFCHSHFLGPWVKHVTGLDLASRRKQFSTWNRIKISQFMVSQFNVQDNLTSTENHTEWIWARFQLKVGILLNTQSLKIIYCILSYFRKCREVHISAKTLKIKNYTDERLRLIKFKESLILFSWEYFIPSLLKNMKLKMCKNVILPSYFVCAWSFLYRF